MQVKGVRFMESVISGEGQGPMKGVAVSGHP